MPVRKIFPYVSSALSVGLGTVLMSSTAAHAGVRVAQINNANLACYLYDFGGIQYDLSALCENSSDAEKTAVDVSQPVNEIDEPFENEEGIAVPADESNSDAPDADALSPDETAQPLVLPPTLPSIPSPR